MGKKLNLHKITRREKRRTTKENMLSKLKRKTMVERLEDGETPHWATTEKVLETTLYAGASAGAGSAAKANARGFCPVLQLLEQLQQELVGQEN